MDWRCLETQTDKGYALVNQIEKLAKRPPLVYILADPGGDFGIFKRGKGYRETMTLLFTPTAARALDALLSSLGAKPCGAPKYQPDLHADDAIGLLFGSTYAWRLIEGYEGANK